MGAQWPTIRLSLISDSHKVYYGIFICLGSSEACGKNLKGRGSRRPATAPSARWPSGWAGVPDRLQPTPILPLRPIAAISPDDVRDISGIRSAPSCGEDAKKKLLRENEHEPVTTRAVEGFRSVSRTGWDWDR